MNEEWRDIPGYGDHYQASSMGRVRSKDRLVQKRTRYGGAPMTQFYSGRIIGTTTPGRDGHLMVHLGVDGHRYSVAVHRLVLLAFIGPPGPDQEGCHWNGVASDNRPENLRWDTHYANNQDRKRHGTYAVGEDHAMAKLELRQAKLIKCGAVTLREATSSFGIGPSQYYRIKKGQSWKGLL